MLKFLTCQFKGRSYYLGSLFQSVQFIVTYLCDPRQQVHMAEAILYLLGDRRQRKGHIYRKHIKEHTRRGHKNVLALNRRLR